MADTLRHREELAEVEARIRAGERLVAEQEVRITRQRELGTDAALSIMLLQQLELSLHLLTNTRSMLLREVQGDRSAM